MNNLIDIFKYIISVTNNTLIPLMIGLGLLAFLWGMFKLMTSAGDEAKQKEAKDIITYGIVGLFVMVSVWGLVNVLIGTFGNDINIQTLPRY